MLGIALIVEEVCEAKKYISLISAGGECFNRRQTAMSLRQYNIVSFFVS